MEKSTHKVEVVKTQLEKHPNADKLSLCKIDGYTVVVNTEMWEPRLDKEGFLVAGHVLPDSIVDTRKNEFFFLFKEGKDPLHRVKVSRLRGVISYGFLVPVDESVQVGDDIAELLGVTHYEPELEFSTRGDNVLTPKLHPLCLQKYDVDSLLRYNHEFTDGEQVICSGKINGSNGRFIYHDNEFYCGSRSFWKKDSPSDLWWRALRNSPSLQEYLKKNPEILVWGEVYGHVKHFRYGLDKVSFIGFDIVREGKFLDVKETISEAEKFSLNWVPTVYEGPFNLDLMKELATKPCKLDPYTLNEGIVVRPLIERWSEKMQSRLILKIINPAYLE